MNVIHCRYGEAAQKAATYNLGMYILHVTGKENLKGGLLDPSKRTPDIWASGMMTALTDSYSSMAASRGDALASMNASLVSRAVGSEQARLEQYAESQEQGWATRVNLSADVLLDSSAFHDIEVLLDLL